MRGVINGSSSENERYVVEQPRVLKWLGAFVVLGFCAALASGNAVSKSSREPTSSTVISEPIWLAALNETYSPSMGTSTFSPLRPGTEIVEDLSREPMAEPMLTTMAAPANTVSTGTVRALIINIQLANGSVADRGLLAPGYQAGVDQLEQMSRGMIDVQVDYFGRNLVVDVPDCSLTSLDTIATKAMEQAATELNLDNYRFISYVLPHSLGCDFAGRGQMPGRSTWNIDFTSSLYPKGIAHEWGHNLSLFHSNAMRCSVNNVPVQFASRLLRGQGACVSVEYSGSYSIMGSGDAGTITFLERFQVGWLRDGEFQTAYQGTYTLNFDAAPALLMLQNNEGDLFMIEYGRAPSVSAFSNRYDWFTKAMASGPFVNGVIVHYVSEYKTVSIASTGTTTPSGYSVTSYVLDMNPSTPHVLDAALQAGQSFVDPTGTLQIDVTSVGDTSAVVNVRGVPFRPNMPTDFVVTQQATLGLVDVAWTAVVATSPVTHYELQISSQSDFAESTTTKVGITGTTSSVAIPGAKYNKEYWVRVAAVNAGGLSDFAQASTAIKWIKPTKSRTAKVGGSCSLTGARTTSGNTKLVCKKVGNKLVWKKG